MGGLLSPWSILITSRTISISLSIVVGSGRNDALFYRLFGMQQSGKSGRKETADCLKAKKARLCRWLKGLSPSPICG